MKSDQVYCTQCGQDLWEHRVTCEPISPSEVLRRILLRHAESRALILRREVESNCRPMFWYFIADVCRHVVVLLTRVRRRSPSRAHTRERWRARGEN